jgi:hypothetical protein
VVAGGHPHRGHRNAGVAVQADHRERLVPAAFGDQPRLTGEGWVMEVATLRTSQNCTSRLANKQIVYPLLMPLMVRLRR